MLKKFFRFATVLSVATVAVVAGMLAQSVSAQENAATVTVSSLGALQEDVCKVAALIDSNYPIFVQMALGQSATFGLDTTKPVAVYANPTETGVGVVAFVPVKSQKMFEAQIEKMRESGTIPETVQIEVKDGYAVIANGTTWESDVPEIKAESLLSLNAKPEMLAPLLALVATLNPDNAEGIATAQEAWGQVENFDFALNITEDGSVKMNSSVMPKDGTEISDLYVACEKLSKTMLGSFYDAEAPVAGQFLSVFGQYEKVAEALSTNEEIPEELRDVILKAIQVEKFDGAFSFYSDDKGVYGVYAMGISNGADISDAVVKAIEDGKMKGTANAGKIGKSITIHEIDAHETVKVALGIHAKYLFVAVSANGSNPVNLMKKTFKERSLKVGKVENNGNFHFDMSILAPYVPQVSDLTGKMNSVGKFANGTYHSDVTIDSALILSAGKIYAAFKSAAEEGAGDEGDEDIDELFGDEE